LPVPLLAGPRLALDEDGGVVAGDAGGGDIGLLYLSIAAHHVIEAVAAAEAVPKIGHAVEGQLGAEAL